MEHIKYIIDTDGVAFITWDVANSPVNIMNIPSMAEFFGCVRDALQDNKVKGVVINSAKNDFIAGGDLKWFLNYDKSKEECFNMLMETHKVMRQMETNGKPFAAAINGLAFGGGCEIALACHYRIMN